MLAQASRLQFSTRLFNLLVTNIPGPQVPLYILGHQLQDLFPLAFLPQGHALAVAIMSYNGQVGYGLLGDFDALPDIDVITAGIDDALAELLAATGSTNGASTGRSNGRPEREALSAASAPLLPMPHHRPVSGPAADMRAKRTQRARRNGEQGG